MIASKIYNTIIIKNPFPTPEQEVLQVVLQLEDITFTSLVSH